MQKNNKFCYIFLRNKINLRENVALRIYFTTDLRMGFVEAEKPSFAIK